MQPKVAVVVIGAALVAGALAVRAVMVPGVVRESGLCSVRLSDGGIATTKLDDADPGACMKFAIEMTQ